jgi:hypothetical protein
MKSVCRGFAAASMLGRPGLQIGPGGRPPKRRVLYGESIARSVLVRLGFQKPSAYWTVASMSRRIPARRRL